jgi:hypothetical protein
MSDELDLGPVEPPILAASPSFGIEGIIERWWQDYFPGSAVARDTQAWNVAHVAKEALKRLLKGSA